MNPNRSVTTHGHSLPDVTPGHLPRRKLIFLTGFMGSGKSTVGRLLAQQLGWHFVDLDPEIEELAGMDIPTIFSRLGEPAFREMETQVLARTVGEAVERGKPTVVALGGGTFAQAQNRTLLSAAHGWVIWLDCPIEVLLRRCATMNNRPLFRDEVSFRRLHEERAASYALADFRISGEDEPRQVVERILALELPARSRAG